MDEKKTWEKKFSYFLTMIWLNFVFQIINFYVFLYVWWKWKKKSKKGNMKIFPKFFFLCLFFGDDELEIYSFSSVFLLFKVWIFRKLKNLMFWKQDNFGVEWLSGILGEWGDAWYFGISISFEISVSLSTISEAENKKNIYMQISISPTNPLSDETTKLH